jgi:hypothetical protein
MILPALVLLLVIGGGSGGGGTKPQDSKPKAKPAATPATQDPNKQKPKGPVGDGFKIELVTVTGGRFSGLVDGAQASRFMKDDALLDPHKLPATDKVELQGVNGLSGKMAVAMKDVASWKLLERVGSGQFTSARQTGDDLRRARLDEEDKRLEQERVKREERKAAAAKKEADDKAKQGLSDQAAKMAAAERLLSRFPPELGWGPDRKAEIERRRVILGLFPTDDEKEFLENFDAWTNAFAMRAERQAKIQQDLEKSGGNKDMPKKETSDPKPPEKGSGS